MTNIHKAVLKREIEEQVTTHGWCDVIGALAIIAEEELKRAEKEAEEEGEEPSRFIKNQYDKLIKDLTELNQLTAYM